MRWRLGFYPEEKVAEKRDFHSGTILPIKQNIYKTYKTHITKYYFTVLQRGKCEINANFKTSIHLQIVVKEFKQATVI